MDKCKENIKTLQDKRKNGFLRRSCRAVSYTHLAAAVSFTLLCCVNVKQRVIDVNLARYEAGIDEELDWGVLWECGYKENAAR